MDCSRIRLLVISPCAAGIIAKSNGEDFEREATVVGIPDKFADSPRKVPVDVRPEAFGYAVKGWKWSRAKFTPRVSMYEQPRGKYRLGFPIHSLELFEW